MATKEQKKNEQKLRDSLNGLKGMFESMKMPDLNNQIKSIQNIQKDVKVGLQLIIDNPKSLKKDVDSAKVELEKLNNPEMDKMMKTVLDNHKKAVDGFNSAMNLAFPK